MLAATKCLIEYMSGKTEDKYAASIDTVNSDNNIGEITPAVTTPTANINTNAAVLDEIKNLV